MMKKAAITALIVFIISANVSANNKLKAVIKKAKASVVCVLSHDSDGKENGQGTGFFISGSGQIVTNVHVVDDAESVSIKTMDGKTYLLNNVINADPDYDLFIFNVIGINSVDNYLTIGKNKLDVGDEVLVIGNPMGLEQTVSTGIVSATRELEEMQIGQLYQITAPISPGSSGSPVMDYEGNVIGVATLQSKEGQNLNFVVPASRLADIMARSANINFAQWKKKGYAVFPETSFGLLNLGYRFLAKERYPEAAFCAAKIIKKEPKYTKAYILAAFTAFEQDKKEMSRRYMEYAVKLEPGLLNVHNNLGLLYHKLKMNDLAANEFYYEIRTHPENETPYCNLADLYSELEMFDDAFKILEKGVIAVKNTSNMHTKMGEIHYKLGDYTETVNELKKAIDINQDNIQAYYDLAIVYSRNYNREGAMDMYEKLKKIDKDVAEKLLNVLNE